MEELPESEGKISVFPDPDQTGGGDPLLTTGFKSNQNRGDTNQRGNDGFTAPDGWYGDYSNTSGPLFCG